MKKFSALILGSMMVLATACSHEPVASDEFSDLALDNSGTIASTAPTAEAVDTSPSGLDLTPPADPAPYRAPRVSRARHAKVSKKHSKKKLAKHSKKHKRTSEELARSR